LFRKKIIRGKFISRHLLRELSLLLEKEIEPSGGDIED